jgi:hypothetical protein
MTRDPVERPNARPRVVKLEDLTPEQRRLVLALIEAARSARPEDAAAERRARKVPTRPEDAAG